MKWKKLGRVFNPQEKYDDIEREWMKEFAQSTSAIVFEDFVRVYFCCRPPRDDDGQYVSYTAFVDLDKKNLRKILRVSPKPVLPLGELGTFDEFAIYPISVLKNNNEFWLYYAGWTRCRSTPYTVSIGLATSKDGEAFKRVSIGPILTNSMFEPFELSGPKVRRFGGKWYMYYLAGEGWSIYEGKAESTYKIRLAVSDDGVHWKKRNLNIIESVLEEECQAGPDVFYLNGLYHMYFSYRHAHNFKNNNRGYRIGYAYSKDAIKWYRKDSMAGIGLSQDGWDSQSQHYPHVFKLENKYYMTYNGNEFGRYGFGLAILEL